MTRRRSETMSILENGRRNVISYTYMDIDKAINDLSNGFIDEILLSKTITYPAKQLGFEKVIKHQRNGSLEEEMCLWRSLQAQRK